MYGSTDRMEPETSSYPSIVSPSSVTRDVLGYQRKTLSALRWQEWLFIGVSVMSLLAVVGLNIQRIVQFRPGGPDSHATDFAFALVLLINTLFCLYYVFSGILRERLFEMYMYIATVVVLVLYIVIQFGIKPKDRQGNVDPLKIVRLVLVLILGPVNIILAIIVVRSFGWLEFRVVGASETIQKMYRQRSLFFSIVMFDLQAAASFITLALSNGTGTSTVTWVLFGVGIPLTMIWSAATNVAVKRELFWLCVVVTVLGILVPAYVLVHIIRLFVEYDIAKSGLNNFLIVSTIVAGGLTVVLRFVCLLELWFAEKNFGKGLKDEVFNFEAITYDIHRVKDLCTCAF